MRIRLKAHDCSYFVWISLKYRLHTHYPTLLFPVLRKLGNSFYLTSPQRYILIWLLSSSVHLFFLDATMKLILQVDTPLRQQEGRKPLNHPHTVFTWSDEPVFNHFIHFSHTRTDEQKPDITHKGGYCLCGEGSGSDTNQWLSPLKNAIESTTNIETLERGQYVNRLQLNLAHSFTGPFHIPISTSQFLPRNE